MILPIASNSDIHDEASRIVAEATEREALDDYSTIVTAVAERLLPSVASLRVMRTSRGQPVGGAGSGIAITPDGFMLTSAHVVSGGSSDQVDLRQGTASFAGGREP